MGFMQTFSNMYVKSCDPTHALSPYLFSLLLTVVPALFPTSPPCLSMSPLFKNLDSGDSGL